MKDNDIKKIGLNLKELNEIILNNNRQDLYKFVNNINIMIKDIDIYLKDKKDAEVLIKSCLNLNETFYHPRDGLAEFYFYKQGIDYTELNKKTFLLLDEIDDALKNKV